jgi:hypothetical protein
VPAAAIEAGCIAGDEQLGFAGELPLHNSGVGNI